MLKNKTLSERRAAHNANLKVKTYKVLILTLLFCSMCFCACASSFAQEEFKYDAKGKRNPFIPLVTPDGRLLKLDTEEENKSALLLEGIIYDKSGLSYAIVNGTVATVGDTLEGYQVLKIEEKKVIFIKEGQIQELALKKEEE